MRHLVVLLLTLRPSEHACALGREMRCPGRRWRSGAGAAVATGAVRSISWPLGRRDTRYDFGFIGGDLFIAGCGAAPSMVNARSVLQADLSGAIAQAGVDATREGRELQNAIRSAIADRRSYCSWDVDHAGWVVTLHHPEAQIFYGRSLEAALAWCLVCLIAPESGIGRCLN